MKLTTQQLENFLGSDHTNKDELLDEIISILNKEVDIDEYVQDVSDYCKSNTEIEENI
tara:strand:+ start:42 stop:215 length:174 start_codon:yes stop_codon:yes gene_type:complete